MLIKLIVLLMMFFNSLPFCSEGNTVDIPDSLNRANSAAALNPPEYGENKENSLDSVAKITSIISNIFNPAGVIIAFIVFIIDRRKRRNDYEDETFDKLNDKRIEMLEKFLEYPDTILDFGKQPGISKDDKKKIIYCHMLFSTIEMAYLKYRKTSGKMIKKQWSGCEEYLKYQYDMDFTKHVNDLFKIKAE